MELPNRIVLVRVASALFKKLLPAQSILQSFARYLGLTLVFVLNSALQEKFNFCFSRVFASIDKIFSLAGKLGTRISFYEV